MAAAPSLDPADLGAHLAQAFGAIRAREFPRAQRLIAAARARFGEGPALIHLEGLLAKAQGDLARAERLMRQSLAPAEVTGRMRAEYANNLGNLLTNTAQPAEAEAAYREALAHWPGMTQAATGLARSLLAQERAEEAVPVLQANAGQGGVEDLVMLSEALAQTGAAREGLALLDAAPAGLQQDWRLPTARARRLQALGRMEEAKAALAPLLRQTPRPEVRVAMAETLIAALDWAGAEAVLREGLIADPLNAELIRRVTALAWMRGDAEGFDAPARAAVAAAPNDLRLRLVLINALQNAERLEEAEAEIREGVQRDPEGCAFHIALAARCARTGRAEEARALIEAALARAPQASEVREQAAIIAMIEGRPQDALAHLAVVFASRPATQMRLALKASALRQAGDPAWRDLADPALVCRTYQLPTPPGFASLAAFNEALAEELRRRHSLKAHPLANSLRGGTQAEINPESEAHPLVRAFLEALRAPIAAHIAAMPEAPGHILWGRRRDGFRLSGCWTVRLRSGGRHVNHIHPAGWLSSAYYVATPPMADAEAPPAERKGWLTFCQPPFDAPGLEPVGWVRPAPGTLALFPSYQWHGVTPFDAGDERMTIAFDVVPAG